MAFPVHMAVMTHKDFPLKLLGLVHVRNKITQQRALGRDEALDLKVFVGGHRDVHNGVEFDLVTEYYDASKTPVWTGLSTMLSRGKGTGKKSGKKSGKKKKDEDKALEFGRYATWDAPADTGRRYAASAGDYNPIHLSALSAKLFGFPRAIAHGMWLKARTAAEISQELNSQAYSMEVAFKRPVLLPSSVMLKYNPSESGIDFLLSDPDGETRHMSGNVSYL
jgi:acyl dehydratase